VDVRALGNFAVAAVGAFLCLPGVAQADNLCVGTVTSPCDLHYITLDDALSAAGGTAGRDTVYIKGDTPFPGNAQDEAGNPVDIIGIDNPVLQDSGGIPYGLKIDEPSSEVSGLTIETPNDRNNYYGLYLAGLATGVTVTGAAGAYTNRTGLYLQGGEFRNGTVTLPVTHEDTAVFSLNGAISILRDATVAGGIGFNFGGPNNARVERTAISAETGLVVTGGTLDVTDTVIRTQRLPGAGTKVGFHVFDLGGGISPVVRGRHLTVVGSDAADTIGVQVDTAGNFRSAEVTLTDAIVRGYPVGLSRTSSAGTANLSVDYSDFQSTNNANTGSGAGSLALGTHNLDADPLFVNAPGGDLRLTKCSPLIDRGSPDALASGESTTDRGANPRVTDGNGDGSAIGDIGAFEYQRPPACSDGTGPPAGTPTPALILYRILPTAFRGAGSGPSVRAAARAPVGAIVSYTLNTPARVAFTVKRKRSGRRGSGGRCVKQTRRNRARRRCTRLVRVKGSFARQGVAGANRFRFMGRIRGRKLAKARYVLYAKPAAGTRVGLQIGRNFRIVRR
jgi:hypothetical protein